MLSCSFWVGAFLKTKEMVGMNIVRARQMKGRREISKKIEKKERKRRSEKKRRNRKKKWVGRRCVAGRVRLRMLLMKPISVKGKP